MGPVYNEFRYYEHSVTKVTLSQRNISDWHISYELTTVPSCYISIFNPLAINI